MARDLRYRLEPLVELLAFILRQLRSEPLEQLFADLLVLGRELIDAPEARGESVIERGVRTIMLLAVEAEPYRAGNTAEDRGVSSCLREKHDGIRIFTAYLALARVSGRSRGNHPPP